jgi:hypothetical protein
MKMHFPLELVPANKQKIMEEQIHKIHLEKEDLNLNQMQQLS